MTTKPENKGLDLIENIQKLLFFVSLLALPLAVLPLPWDITEYSMSIVMLFFATIVVSLELCKLFWSGRAIIKRTAVDTGIILLSVSIILSTIFSISTQSSLWGFDYRLGTGTIVFISSLIYLYSARIFLKNYEDVITSIRFLLIGVTLGALFSILSFWGINVLNTVPGFETHFTVGLPLYSSARVSLVIWGSAALLSLGLLFDALKQSKASQLIFPISVFAINFVALILFSLVQGWPQVLLLIVVFSLLLIVPLLKKRPLNKTYVFSSLILLAILLAGFLLFRIPQFKELVVRDSSKLITQITIDPQVSWRVATTSMSDSVVRGFVGLGQDAFSVGYNLYRPLTAETILLNTTNFTNANVELVNILATRGVFGIIAWLALGLFIVKSLFDSLKKNSLESPADFFLVGLDIAALYVYVSSAFIYSTFLTIFLLLLFITLTTILKNERHVDTLDSFILNVGLFLRRSGESSTRPIATTMVLVISAVAIAALVYLGRYTVSSGYVLEAESMSAKGRELAQNDNLSESERARILIESSNLYGRAIRLSPNNDVLHRRGSLIVLQYVEYLAQKYNETEIEEEKKNLFEQIAAYIEIVVEESKRATELNPQTYSNWATRSSSYSKLVGLGLTSYTRSALTAMQTAAQYNPLNYELYYNAAQLYVVNNDNDMALRTLSQVFSINPDHVPSLILGGELSLNDGDSRQALRYFEDAKRVMDGVGGDDSEVYDYVVSKISELDQGGSVRQEVKQDSEN